MNNITLIGKLCNAFKYIWTYLWGVNKKEEEYIRKKLAEIEETEKRIEVKLNKILHEIHKNHLAVKIVLTDKKNPDNMTNLSLTLALGGSPAGIGAVGIDANGNKGATVQSPMWTGDDNGSIVNIDVAPDGQTAKFSPVSVGVAKITVHGNDANGNPIATSGTATATVTLTATGLAVEIQLVQL